MLAQSAASALLLSASAVNPRTQSEKCRSKQTRQYHASLLEFAMLADPAASTLLLWVKLSEFKTTKKGPRCTHFWRTAPRSLTCRARLRVIRSTRRRRISRCTRRLSSTIFLSESGDLITPVVGYLNVHQMELYIKMIKKGDYQVFSKPEDFENYKKYFQPKFKLKGK